MRRMGIGLGVGINRSNYAQGIFNAYSARVVADGGVVEGGACVDAVSGLLLNASLLLIPSGYKGGKLYSEIPTNGNGDLTWTRGSDAFRTNASGLIQRVPWNLFSQSEAFETASWTKVRSTITANSTTAPNGTTTADTMTCNDTGTSGCWATQTTTITSERTCSIYAKANTGFYFQIHRDFGVGVVFNLSNGTVKQSVSATGTIENVGNGWYKCTATFSGSGQTLFLLGNASMTVTSWASTNNESAFIWGAQLVEGTTAQTYLPTTDRLNFPRLSYMYGSCPALLLEPQRTNSICNSIASGAVVGTPGTTPTNWTAVGTSLGISRSISGIGIENGLSYVDITYSGTATSTGTINTRFEGQGQIAVSNGQFWSLSTYLKNVSGTVPTLTLTMGERSSSAYVKFATQNITTDTSLNRYVYSRAIDGGATVVAVDVFLDLNIVNGQSYNFTIRVAQPQMELGTYATTAILTTGSATATRVADSFSRNNIFTNGLISASGGTWFVELRGNVAYTGGITQAQLLGLGNDVVGATANNFYIACSDATRVRIWKQVAGTISALYTTTTDTTKIAIKWNGTSCDVFANGAKVVSATSFTTTALESLRTAAVQHPYFIQQMALYPTPLSDTDCATLTTL